MNKIILTHNTTHSIYRGDAAELVRLVATTKNWERSKAAYWLLRVARHIVDNWEVTADDNDYNAAMEYWKMLIAADPSPLFPKLWGARKVLAATGKVKELVPLKELSNAELSALLNNMVWRGYKYEPLDHEPTTLTNVRRGDNDDNNDDNDN